MLFAQATRNALTRPASSLAFVGATSPELDRGKTIEVCVLSNVEFKFNFLADRESVQSPPTLVSSKNIWFLLSYNLLRMT
jgi:hypothetical protein